MKKIILTLNLFFCVVVCNAQEDSTGLAGDHFSLQGALELFSKATSIEEYEKALNTEANHVNNLDLNEDGEIDYVRVENHSEGDAHAFVLQVAVSEKESQDVAVIELEKTAEANAQIQIAGDEELYGKDVFTEPLEEEVKGGKGGPADYTAVRVVVINVWLWPSVRFVFAPAYRPWISPWRWRAYPTWWKPWKPLGWRIHHGHCAHFRMHYHVVSVHRCTRAHGVYHTHRVTSATVHNKYKDAHVKHKKNTTAKVQNEKAQSGNGKNETVKRDNTNAKSAKPAKNEKAEKKTAGGKKQGEGKKAGGKQGGRKQ
ncbi:MAG: hypothetical protein ACKVOR_13555 [Flavobacteriales bacterium]